MGSKSSKHRVTAIEPLNRETIDELCQDTGFTEEEILAWHTNFYKDCPDGKLTLKQFEQEYAKIMGKPTQKSVNYIRHMFNVYDQDKNQFIDFKEFVMALSAASVVNRVRLIETLFHVFDLDNDGKITKEEIGKMLHTLVDVTDSNDKHRNRHDHHNANQQEQNKKVDLQKRIDDAFNELNGNDDDHITKDEFIEWYMKSGLISDVQTADLNATDPTRIPQKIGKKSRKFKKMPSNTKPTPDQEDSLHPTSYLVRHMSRMTERKTPASYSDTARNTTDFRPDNDSDDDDEDNTDGIRVTRTTNRPAIRVTTDSNYNLSQHSAGNERWQHLFHSVLGQIRTESVQDAEQPQPIITNGKRNTASSNPWRRKVDENFESADAEQRPNGSTNLSYSSAHQTDRSSSDEGPPSPDIITIRL